MRRSKDNEVRSQGDAQAELRALWPYVKHFRDQWPMMTLGLLLGILSLLAGIGLLSLSGWFLSATAVAGLSLAGIRAFNFYTPAAGVRFFSITRTLSRYAERLATHEATFRLLTQLRVQVWRKLLPQSAKNLQSLRRGDLLNRLVSDIDTLDHLYLRLATPMAASLLLILALCLFLASFDTRQAMVLLAILLCVWTLVPLLFYRLGRSPGRGLINARQGYRIELLEFIQGQAELSLFGATGRFRAKMTVTEQSLYGAQRRMAGITGLSQALVLLSHGIALLLILYLAADGVGSSSPPGPLYGLMVFSVLASMEMLLPIALAFQQLSACVLAASRINEIGMQTPEISFGAPRQTPLGNGRGELQIRDLRFGYSADAPVLKGINLHLMPGTKVALLGPTGCGKSSLLSLITRDWLPQVGDIRLDGHDIADFSEAELRRAMSVMSQRVVLFAATLRDNLALALPPEATVEDERLIEVLKRVGLGSLLQGEAPLDVWIGDGGRQLSGGERRRIGVARVLLRDAPLLLLDEPTEGLDRRTEREILRLLLDFAKDKTLLLISHRLTAMAQMDAIHLLDGGVISASGTHQSLLADNDYYLSLQLRLA